MANIFISKLLDKYSILYELEDDGHQIEAHALVEHLPVKVSVNKAYDWIYFDDKQSLDISIENPSLRKLMGQSKVALKSSLLSREYFMQTRKKADWVFEPNPTPTAQDLKEVFKDESVLWCFGKENEQTIFDTKNSSRLCVYETKMLPLNNITICQFLIFHHELAVDNYFKIYQGLDEQKFIALSPQIFSRLELFVAKDQIYLITNNDFTVQEKLLELIENDDIL